MTLDVLHMEHKLQIFKKSQTNKQLHFQQWTDITQFFFKFPTLCTLAVNHFFLFQI